MAFISLKDFLSIWHFKLIGLIGLRAVSERVKGMYLVHGTPVVEHTTGAKFVTSSSLIDLIKHPDNSITQGLWKGPLT